jgi:anti-sigma factor RsiW
MASGDGLTCDEAQPLLRDFGRGRLDAATRERVEAHLKGCADCARLADEERRLDERLERELPQYAAPLALKRRLRARLPMAAPAPPRRARRWVAATSIAAAAALALLVGVKQPWNPGGAPAVREAVADHLRVVSREHPVDIESGGPHQVKPWFTGRIDFALPSVFGGDGDFALQGGSVGYFFDRKAAVLVYKRRLHTISLFVFPAEGLTLPRPNRSMDRERVALASERGFNVVSWREGGLGYALVSDLNADELLQLAGRVASPQ